MSDLQFALGNLQSPKGQARRTLLSFLRRLFLAVDDQRLNAYAELAFLHFGARIANETDDAITAKLRKTIEILLGRVAPAKFLSLWNLMVRWASAGGNQVRAGLLLLAVTVAACPDAMANLVDALQRIVDAHIASESPKVRIAAIELHRRIIAAYASTGETQLLPLTVLIEFINGRETCAIGCEILKWYLSACSTFSPDTSDLIATADALADVVVAWRGSIKPASESLHDILVRLPEPACSAFFARQLPAFLAIDASEALLAVMRVAVATVVDRGTPVDPDLLRAVLRFVVRVQAGEETRMPAEKAVEVLRHAVDADAFTREWTAILAEAEERRQKEEAEREIDAEIDPEAMRARIADERKRKKIEERKKRWWADTGERGTLHPFGEDGLPVEKLPLAKEFQ